MLLDDTCCALGVPGISVSITGYAVDFDDEESDYCQRVVIGGENQFFAESPEVLLGLILSYETSEQIGINILNLTEITYIFKSCPTF